MEQTSHTHHHHHHHRSNFFERYIVDKTWACVVGRLGVVAGTYVGMMMPSHRRLATMGDIYLMTVLIAVWMFVFASLDAISNFDRRHLVRSLCYVGIYVALMLFVCGFFYKYTSLIPKR